MKVSADPKDLGPGDDNGSEPTGSEAPSIGDLRSNTMAEQGRPLPIVYGTRKVAVLLIEKFVSTLAKPPDWQNPHDYYTGDYLCGGGNVYLVTANGTSGSSFPNPAPAADFLWGGSVPLKYIQAQPMQVYQHHFLGALCEGEADGIKNLWWDKEVNGTGSLVTEIRALKFLGGPDAANQVVASPFDGGASYQHTAVLYPKGEPTTGVFTGTQAEIPALAVEVQALRFGASTPDVNPADIVNDILTHTRRGCAWSGTRVDTSITGTGAAGYRVYCDAAGFRFSVYLDRQRTALEILSEILAATNSDAIWSGGKLKIIPLGDQSITAPVYGATNYVPANTAQYALTVADFLDKAAPVQVSRRPDADCFNSIPVQFIDRGSNSRYQTETVEDPDMTDVEVRGGLKRGGTLALSFAFPDGSAPIQLSRILAQRSLNCRNTYRFRVSWKYVLTEPTDVVTVVVVNPFLGTMLSLRSVRIVEWEENEDGTITITAEDYKTGVQAAASYTPQAAGGYKPNDKASTSIIPMTIDSVTTSIKPGAVPNIGLTHQNCDNQWPNATSENTPPSGISVLNDGTSPEWDYRKDLSTLTTQSGTLSGVGQTITAVSTANFPASGTVKILLTGGTWTNLVYTGKTATSFTGCTGAGAFSNGALVTDAYSGGWVREIDNTGGGAQLLFNRKLPCRPGDSISLSAQMRMVTVAAQTGVQIKFYDGADNFLGGNINSSALTTWAAVSTDYSSGLIPAPANTAYVLAQLVVGIGSKAQFDSIDLRRIPAPLSIYPVTLTYAATMTPDASLGNVFIITATNNTAFTVANPTNPSTGQIIRIRIRNASGGALGAVTWGAAFKMSAWTSPANANSRMVAFQYDGTNWVEIRPDVDVPN